jgi:hypothetical protein
MQRLLMMQPKRSSQRLQNKVLTYLNEDSLSQNGPEQNNDSKDAIYIENGLLSIEQERARKEEIARQREERFKQRLLRRETQNDNANFSFDDDGENENSQASSSFNNTNMNNNHQISNRNQSSDFNAKNYLLMNKVLNKILQSKYAWPFKSPVSEEDAPDYNEIIKVGFFLNHKCFKVKFKY